MAFTSSGGKNNLNVDSGKSAFNNNANNREVSRSGNQTPSVTNNSYNLVKGESWKSFAASAAGNVVSQAGQQIGRMAYKDIKTRLSMMNDDNANNIDSNDGDKGKGRKGRKGRKAKSQPTVSKGNFFPKERDVANLTFETGIRAGTVVNTHDVGDTAKFSPASMMSGCLLACKDQGTLVDNQLNSSLYHQYLRACQILVSYRVSDRFDAARFFAYFNAVTRALQVYYQVDAILAYTDNNGSNLNEGIYDLRKKLSAENLSKHRELEIALGGLVCPPRLLNFIRYMYQNFVFSQEDNAPIFRLGYLGSFRENSEFDLSYYQDQVIEGLRNTLILGDIPSILAVAFPAWTMGILPPSSKDPIYDLGFQTFWHNSEVSFCFTRNDVGVSYTKDVFQESTQYTYYMFANEIDGIYYAMSSTHLDNDVIQTGFWEPITNKDDLSVVADTEDDNKWYSSLICYTGNNTGLNLGYWSAPQSRSISGLAGVHDSVYVMSSGALTNQYNGDPRTFRLQYNSLINMGEVVANCMDYLYSVQQ